MTEYINPSMESRATSIANKVNTKQKLKVKETIKKLAIKIEYLLQSIVEWGKETGEGESEK